MRWKRKKAARTRLEKYITCVLRREDLNRNRKRHPAEPARLPALERAIQKSERERDERHREHPPVVPPVQVRCDVTGEHERRPADDGRRGSQPERAREEIAERTAQEGVQDERPADGPVERHEEVEDARRVKDGPGQEADERHASVHIRNPERHTPARLDLVHVKASQGDPLEQHVRSGDQPLRVENEVTVEQHGHQGGRAQKPPDGGGPSSRRPVHVSRHRRWAEQFGRSGLLDRRPHIRARNAPRRPRMAGIR